MHRALACIAVALSGCVYLPRTTTVYDEDCQIEAKHMQLQMAQIGALGHCQGRGCAELLVAAGAVAAASAVVERRRGGDNNRRKWKSLRERRVSPR